MRVEFRDWNGQAFSINSRNPKLIGEWFAEYAPQLMTADARLEVQIRIWPDSEDEAKTIGQPATEMLTQEGLLRLAQVILDASQKLAEIEESRK